MPPTRPTRPLRPLPPLLLLAVASAMVAAPVAAQDMYSMPAEVLQWAITDGIPLELDDAATLEALRDVEGRIAGQSIHDCIAQITQDPRGLYRVMGTPTQQMFLDTYGSVFSDLGLPSAIHSFPKGAPGLGPAQLPESFQGGANLLGVLPGNNLTKWIVLGGHYDTREFTIGGGALDNAAGICTVQELAKAFKGHVDAHGPLEASVVFAWYDGEEWGLYGAIAFAQDFSVAAELLGLPEGTSPTVLVSQSFDMPGLNYPAKNNWVQYGDPAALDEYAVLNLRTAPIHAEEEWTCWSYGCYEELKERPDFEDVRRANANYQFLVREVAYDVLALPPQYIWVYDDHYGRSDHIPLIALGAAGMRVQGSHDNEYPHYHQPSDSLPGLYAITGGTPDGIIAGFDTEAKAGGLVPFYVAKTGGLGAYGDKLYPLDGNAPVQPAGDARTPGAETPLAIGIPLAALGLALAHGARRMRGNA